jgi:hypothetical protein
MVGRTASRRAARWTALCLGAVLAASGAACTGDSEDTVVAAPSALADAAEEIRSARIEMTDTTGTTVMRVDGDDVAVETVRTQDDGAPFPGDYRSITVGGTTYTTMGSDRYVEFPEQTDGDDLSIGSFNDFAIGMVETIDELLRSSVVGQPGERTTIDGEDVTRYGATVDAKSAFQALDDAMQGSLGGSATPDDGETSRSDRIDDYAMDHMTVDLVGDVDDDGNLRRLTMTTSADLSEFPDCERFDPEPTEATFTVTEINEPQHIEAPPADQVQSIDEYTDELANGGGFFGEPDPDAPELDEPQADIEPDAAGDTVDTATGARTRAEVLDYLRRWAERAGIDWRRMALPDDSQMVAWFDQFYADDLTKRGPELTTSLGPYPKGYLVEAVGELDPSVDATTLDDAALVAAYEAARGAGVLPSTSEWADDDVPVDSEVTTDDGSSGPIIGDSSDSWEDDYGMEEYEEDFAGCPE